MQARTCKVYIISKLSEHKVYSRNIKTKEIEKGQLTN